MILCPSFFVVGAQKAGTTALHNYLARHPDVYLPAIKETHFFDDGHGEYKRGIGYYLEKYFSVESRRVEIAGEVDPEYLFFPEVPERISREFPMAKLIFMFREPVSRSYSHYQMSLRRGLDRLPFARAIEKEAQRMAFMPEDLNEVEERVLYRPKGDTQEESRRLFNHVVQSSFSYVGRGFYFEQVQRYLEVFRKEQMLFLLSEDLLRRPEETLKSVYLFLKLRETPYAPLPDTQSNPASQPYSLALQDFVVSRSPIKRMVTGILPAGVRQSVRNWILVRNMRTRRIRPVDASVRTRLSELYREDIIGLSQVIEKDLSGWLKCVQP